MLGKTGSQLAKMIGLLPEMISTEAADGKVDGLVAESDHSHCISPLATLALSSNELSPPKSG